MQLWGSQSGKVLAFQASKWEYQWAQQREMLWDCLKGKGLDCLQRTLVIRLELSKGLLSGLLKGSGLAFQANMWVTM